MDYQVAFSVFGLKVFWYGILLTTGMLLAVQVAALEMRRRGYPMNLVYDGAVVVLLLGVVGGRLYHVFSTPNDGSFSGWPYYSQNPWEILNIRGGGLGIYGGILGGIIGLVIVCVRKKLNFRMLGDAVCAGVPLGQAVGRWGNYANQELYGGPTGSSWFGLLISPEARIRTPKYDFTNLQLFPLNTRFHPTFLYESMWSLLGCGLLLYLARRKSHLLKVGDIGALYLIWYGVGRAWVELFFRPDAWTVGTLPTAVLISLLVIIAGICVLIYNRVRPAQVPVFEPASA